MSLDPFIWHRPRRSLRKQTFRPGEYISPRQSDMDPESPPILSSQISDQAYTVDIFNSSNFSANFQGATSYAISPGGAPTGMSFNTSTGVLSGTPTIAEEIRLGVVITATNANGSTPSNAFNIAVADAPPIFDGNIEDFALTEGVTMTPRDVSDEFSGFNLTYSFVGTPPAGITINSSGVISGTPNAGSAGTYTVRVQAQNSGGIALSNFFDFVVSAPAAAPEFTGNISNISGEWGSAITPVDVSGEFSGQVDSYSEVGVWPTGITVNSSTGVISGTATGGSGNTPFPNLQVRATNASGSADSNLFTITIDDALSPPTFTGNIANLNLTWDQAMTPVDVSGEFSGTITGYNLLGTWPTGISISAAGVISGTPTGGSGSSTFPALQVEASNAAGSANSNLFQAQVEDAAGGTVHLSEFTAPNGTLLNAYTPDIGTAWVETVNGGEIDDGICHGNAAANFGAWAAHIEAGISDCKVFSQKLWRGAGTQDRNSYRLTFRYVDDNNHWRVAWYDENDNVNQLILYETTGGSAVNRGSFTTNDAPNVLRAAEITCNGTSITVDTAGGSIPYTSSVHQAATKAGFDDSYYRTTYDAYYYQRLQVDSL